MRKLYIIFVFFAAAFTAKGQADSATIDSLRNVFHTTTDDSVKLNIAYYFISDYEISDPDSTVSLALYALNLAEKLKDTTYMAGINDYLGIMSTYQGDNYKALQYELEALKLYEAVGNDDGISNIWNNIGESYYELDLFNEAYDYYNKSLNKFRELNDSLGLAISTYNVGRVLKSLGQLEKAKKFINEAKELSEAIGDKEGIPYALNDLGEIYIKEGKLDEALTTLAEALDKCEELKDVLEIYILTPEILNKMAKVYRMKNNPNEALNYHNRALAYYQNLGNESGIGETYLGKGRTFIMSNRINEAKRFLNLSLSIANDENNMGLKTEAFEELSKLYEKQGNYREALEFYKKFKNIGDSLYSEKKSEQFAQLQVKYETQQKDVEIALLNEREEQRQSQLKNEEFLRNVLVVILAFTAVLLVTLYRSGARRKKINELLVVHQKEIEAQSKELESLLQMKDKFFSIVSHDLRSPINALVGILDMAEGGHLTQEELQQVTKSLRIRLKNTRKLLDNLLDWAMVQMNEIEIKQEPLELKLIVEENLTFFREVNDKNISFFNKINKEIVVADRNMLDLIIRNLVSNSIKFTEEKGYVEVYAETEGENYVVCIGDNGVGMSQDQVEKVFDNALIYTTPGTSNEKGTGLGLKLCKEFVDRMGGKIWVESEKGKGSVFKFTVKKAENESKKG